MMGAAPSMGLILSAGLPLAPLILQPPELALSALIDPARMQVQRAAAPAAFAPVPPDDDGGRAPILAGAAAALQEMEDAGPDAPPAQTAAVLGRVWDRSAAPAAVETEPEAPRVSMTEREKARRFFRRGVLGRSEYFDEWFEPATDFLRASSGGRTVAMLAYHHEAEHEAYVIDLVERAPGDAAARGAAKALIASVAELAAQDGSRLLLSPIDDNVAERYRELGFVRSEIDGFWVLPEEASERLRRGDPAAPRTILTEEMVREAPPPAKLSDVIAALGRAIGDQKTDAPALEALAQGVRLVYGTRGERPRRFLARVNSGAPWDAVEELYDALVDRL